MTSIKEHTANLTKPVAEGDALAFLIEDLVWERDVYLNALVKHLVNDARQELGIKRLNN